MILEQGIEQHYKAIHGMKVRYMQIHYIIVACIAQKITTYFFKQTKEPRKCVFIVIITPVTGDFNLNIIFFKCVMCVKFLKIECTHKIVSTASKIHAQCQFLFWF